MTNDRKRFYSDLLERVLWTAVQSFLGVLIADGLGANIADGAALKVAGLAALISAAKCLLATQIGASNTAATLPVEDDTPEVDAGHADGVYLGLLLVVGVLVLLIFLGVGPAHAGSTWN